MPITLYGYHYSVYVRVARLVFSEKGIQHRHVEIDPFAENVPEEYLEMHPFGRVPTLVHDDFVLYETTAITRYIDEAFDGPPLQPTEPRRRARMTQFISAIDSYGYWPMVRQVFSNCVFGPRIGRPVDDEEVRVGLIASSHFLDALEMLIGDDDYLVGDKPGLADFHLAPMVGYFSLAPEGGAVLSGHEKVSRWWKLMMARRSLEETEPGFPD